MRLLVVFFWNHWAHNHGSSVGHCEARISPGSGIVKGTIVEVGLVHLVLHDNFRVVGGGPFLSLAVFRCFSQKEVTPMNRINAPKKSKESPMMV